MVPMGIGIAIKAYNIMQIQKYILVYEMALITNTVGLRVVTATTQLLGACDAG